MVNFFQLRGKETGFQWRREVGRGGHMPPGAIREGAPSGAPIEKNVNIFLSNGDEQVQA